MKKELILYKDKNVFPVEYCFRGQVIKLPAKYLNSSLNYFNIRYLVEVAGVEPASEVKIQRTSTHIVCFCFNLKVPDKQGSL